MIDDPDFDDLEALVQSPPSAGGADETSGLLLELLCAVTKLAVFLNEADEGEFRVIAARLQAFKVGVASLPDSARPRRKIGFKASKKTRRRRG